MRFKALNFILLSSAMVIWGGADASWHETEADSIIIGGKRVIIEQVIDYDTLDPGPSSAQFPDSISKIPKRQLFSIGLEGAYTMSDLTALPSDLSGVDAFVQQKPAGVSDFGCSFDWQINLHNNIWLSLGAGYQRWSFSHLFFDEAQLSDSLYRFSSPSKSLLNQITRYRYELGEELDTLPMSLEKKLNHHHYLTIPTSLLFRFNRKQHPFVVIQAGVQHAFLLQSSGEGPLLINENARVVTSSISIDHFYRYVISGLFAVGIEKGLNSKVTVFAKGRMIVPFIWNSGDNSYFRVRSWSPGIILGINLNVW